ncbi:MAG TPA: hypothetical protein VN678_13230 [Acidobacteriaceae bacterium]|nr:hypothetical protein [Acidobacteriaceae bacterium]
MNDCNEPSEEGRRRWRSGNGYLKLRPLSADEPAALPCTCATTCPASCTGACGCEACALAKMIREDQRAIWDAAGNLVDPDHLGPLWGWLEDPSQPCERCGASSSREASPQPQGGLTDSTPLHTVPRHT